MDGTRTVRALGTMSGTSLDGLDLCLAEFSAPHGAMAFWNHRILRTETVPYSADWRRILSHSHLLPQHELWQLDVLYAKWMATQVKRFLKRETVDVIGSHGHTVHHRPDQGKTVQIGNGQTLADETRLPVIYDFRQPDVDLGGQGAPLVPIGDELLFGDYEVCLNLGGFMNASWREEGVRRAGDIGPMNIGLNHIARLLDQEYDAGGKLARQGQLIPSLYDFWNGLSFFAEAPPKSLGREFMDQYYLPYFSDHAPQDVLHTLTRHAALQLSRALADRPRKVLATGGGVYNDFFRELVVDYGGPELVVPEAEVVEFKEALVFGFMAVLKQRGEVNVLSSVTGGREDHASGREAHPPPTPKA